MLWQPYPHTVEGIQVDGDPTRWTTRCPPYLNGLYALLHWKQVVVITLLDDEELENSVRGYHVGFRDFRGNCMIRIKPITTRYFAALVGREPCNFFAVRKIGDAIGIALNPETMRMDKASLIGDAEITLI